jgi:Archaeal flagellins
MDKFMRAMHRLYKGENGLTGLETAIILIAFVTVAAVFGYAVLSAGIFSSEKAKGTVYQGMEEAKSSMEIKGSVMAESSDNSTVATVKFIVGNAIGDYPIDLTPPSNDDNITVISYSDENQYVAALGDGSPIIVASWNVTPLAGADSDNLLEIGEQFLVTVALDSLAAPKLQQNQVFTIEVKPPHGATIIIERRTPPQIDPVMNLM